MNYCLLDWIKSNQRAHIFGIKKDDCWIVLGQFRKMVDLILEITCLGDGLAGVIYVVFVKDAFDTNVFHFHKKCSELFGQTKKTHLENGRFLGWVSCGPWLGVLVLEYLSFQLRLWLYNTHSVLVILCAWREVHEMIHTFLLFANVQLPLQFRKDVL